MTRLAITLALFAMVAPSTTIADEPAPRPGDTPSTLADKVRQNPDDAQALNAYFSQEFGAIMRLVGTDADQAEKKLAALRQMIETLTPTKDDAKTVLQRGRTALRFYDERIALSRVTLAELEERLKANADDADALTRYSGKAAMEISAILRSNPDSARKRLATAREFLTSLKSTARAETRPKIDQVLARLAAYQSSLDAEDTHKTLIGKKAAPLDIETWVNGSPVTDEDLKGKVVLLDFWAVWCGPCIATFPHLREWNEKYADKGLVIIGMTRYYNFDWDEKADKAIPSKEKVAPEKEQAMLVKFAAQHKLSHRFGIQKGNTLSKYYGVTGIPQAVLIDREGTVRLIRVGSGDANAKDISELLEKLLTPGANVGG
jgi:thiol-disulfide isomerase/thioredoxin